MSVQKNIPTRLEHTCLHLTHLVSKTVCFGARFTFSFLTCDFTDASKSFSIYQKDLFTEDKLSDLFDEKSLTCELKPLKYSLKALSFTFISFAVGVDSTIQNIFKIAFNSFKENPHPYRELFESLALSSLYTLLMPPVYLLMSIPVIGKKIDEPTNQTKD